MWGNLVGVIIGGIYYCKSLHQFNQDFLAGLIGFLGTCSSVINLLFAVIIQIKGYSENQTRYLNEPTNPYKICFKEPSAIFPEGHLEYHEHHP